MGSHVNIAVLPVAGLGSRFLPATKSMPKEMLPVVDKPLVAYAVEEAVRAGIRTFVFVTSRHKKSLEDYFDDHPEMAQELAAAQKADLQEVLAQTRPAHCQFYFVRQTEPRGTGDALFRAQALVQDQPFAVLFPDELMLEAPGNAGALSELVQAFEATGGKSVLGVVDVPAEQTRAYGIVEPGRWLNADRCEALGIVEKPKNQPPSTLATVGRYIFSAGFMQRLAVIQDQLHGREVFMTDAIAAACAAGDVVAQRMSAERFDCGSKQGYLQAQLAFALRRPELADELKAYLHKVCMQG